ncbi:Protein phosphatase 2A, regulatory subunit PR55 [Cynara cardunculus var. scolymus]|uniref:Protein phosphatase 2A, regulatory subunit PR55 n=1 Tax=Cynara cardunculus var. scolymus TaxID=59895 RepID=A0A103YKX4_CYNCS|nr:Protein phosphatase 2A, regulatory subunit PR55 [Cynara cardunculus var. scolymus]
MAKHSDAFIALPASTAVDIISGIEFDKTGNHLATRDRGGRVVLFEKLIDSRHPEFRYKTEFQIHEPKFDYLKSLEIEVKINKIRWFQTANSAIFLLSTNDKTILEGPRKEDQADKQLECRAFKTYELW